MKEISWLFLIVLLILPLAATAEVPSFYCPFDGNYKCVPDISPLEAKGEFKEGLYGKGISVQDGTTVSYPANNIFNIQSGTISLWFKPDGTLTDKPHVFFHHQSPSNNANLRFRILPSSQNGQCSKCYELAFFIGDGDVVVSKELLNTLASVRGWYHFAASWSSTNLKIYLNGQLISEKNQPISIGSQDNQFFIGSDRGSIGANGVIDEFALYTTALSSAQIKMLFTQGMSGPIQPTATQETEIVETTPPKTETIQTPITPTVESKTEPVKIEQQPPPKQYVEQKQPLQKSTEPSKEAISKSVNTPHTEQKSGYSWLIGLIMVSGLVALWMVLRTKEQEKSLKNKQHLLDTTTQENRKKYELLLRREQELVAKEDEARKKQEETERNRIKMEKMQELRRQKVEHENTMRESENARKYQEFKTKMHLKKDEQTIPGATKKFKELFGKSREEVAYLQKYVMEEILATENKEFVEREVNKALTKEEPRKVPEQFLSDMQQIDNMSGKEFEDFLEKMFTNLNYAVKRRTQTRDGGVDLVLENEEGITVVQAKRYKITQSVGIDAVQAIAANRRTHKANKVMVVTTSSKFTIDAQKLASSEEVELVNRAGLKDLIRQAKLIKNG